MSGIGTVEAPVVDPRFRARLEEVAEAASRVRRRRLLALTGAALALLIGVALAYSPLVDVDRIDVVGAERASADDVRAATGIELGEALLTVDPARALRGVEQVPWVDQAEVVRNWPGAVTVTVEERSPLAVVDLAEGAVIIDHAGRQLQVLAAAGPEMPRLVGVLASGVPGEQVDALGRPALDVLAAAPDVLAASLVAVRTAADGSLSCTLRAPRGATVEAVLGEPTQLEAKVVALATLAARTDLSTTARIDVRVPTAPVLTRR